MDFATFCERYRGLIGGAPRYPTISSKNENSPFGDYIFNCSNVYFGFDAVECRDSFYLFDSFQVKSSADCSYAVESDLCHESLDIFRCYNCDYMNNCDRCINCSYCKECTNCQDCFGSIYLRNKRFCFFNRQLDEGEYYEKIQEYKKEDPEQILREVEEFSSRFPERASREESNENCSLGNYYYHNKDSHYLFDSVRNEECAYLFDSHNNKNSFDQTYSVYNELCYELIDCVRCYESFFSRNLVNCISCHFSLDLMGCTDCFGCAFLNKKQYCILNKQYTPEEYRRRVNEILSSMKSEHIEHFAKTAWGF